MCVSNTRHTDTHHIHNDKHDERTSSSIKSKQRLWQTREVLHQCLINPQLSVRQSLEDTDSYLDAQVLTCVVVCCCCCFFVFHCVFCVLCVCEQQPHQQPHNTLLHTPENKQHALSHHSTPVCKQTCLTRHITRQCYNHYIQTVLQTQELFDPLQLMYSSLVMTGDESTANHKLLDVLRQVQTFGLSLMKLDIRQESTRHAEVGLLVGWCVCCCCS